MALIDFITINIIPFLFILTVLVFVHEMGHFLIARRYGVRVEVFSIGFGPEIYGWTDKNGTRWKFSAVPLGGYVKMFGMDEAFEDGGEDGEDKKPPLTPEELAVSFHHKPLGQRAAIVAGGPLANFLFAIVVLAGLFSIVGSPSPLAGVGEVKPSSAAEEAGIKVGDRIVSIDGQPITLFEDLRRIVSVNSGVRLTIVVLRQGGELTLKATPKPYRYSGPDGVEKDIGLLGVMPDPNQVKYERHNILEAAYLAVDRSFGLTMQILTYLGDMITGSRSAEDLGGPIRIAKISGDMAQGGVINIIFFLAALSLNLGLINLFPIPVLDGGHLIYYAAEAVRGRPLGPQVQEYGFRFGMILVFLLLIFATWNDLVQLKVFEFFKQLIT
ncbi:MAG: RIP metalloprotease RseP [Rhodospirillales bacterium]